MPAPLLSDQAYVWRVTDDTGAIQLGPITPVSTVISKPDYLTNLLIRLLQGGVNNLEKPKGVGGVEITTQMPRAGWQALPFIIVNLDLIQQSEVQIGEDVLYPSLPGQNPNQSSIWSNAKRIWRVSVFSRDARERDFYRDNLLTIFRVLKATVFTPLGYNVSHSYQAVSGTDANEWEGHTPGFHYADLMLEIDGLFNAVVLSNYGLIGEIDVGVTVRHGDFNVTIDPFDFPSSA
jgi:hypothetical protein